jgi:hypothetical protein
VLLFGVLNKKMQKKSIFSIVRHSLLAPRFTMGITMGKKSKNGKFNLADI